MYYYFIIAFQAFCIYHLFKNRNEYYWVFIIIFVPLVGCIIYLVTQVFNKRDTDKIQENLTTIINPSKKVKDLERKLQFSETYQNRVNLADAYLASQNYENAIVHYEKALKDTTQNDFYVKIQLIKALFYNKAFDQVVALSQPLENHKEFGKSEIPFLYGMALAELGKTAEAQTQLQIIDKPYSNYNERLAFARFLISIHKTNEAKDILEELYVETQHMTKMNRRIYRNTIVDIEKLKSSL